MPLVGMVLNFGTFGALIRIRSQVPSRRVMFDIGVAGPIAGFVACLVVLAVGVYSLPDPSAGAQMIRALPGHSHFVSPPDPSIAQDLVFGKTLLYAGFEQMARGMGRFVPPMSEMYHFPFLLVGWFGLFVTAMNLLPIGQTDGGHVVYAMFGRAHRIVARAAFGALIVLGSIGALKMLFAIGAEFSLYVGWTNAAGAIAGSLERFPAWTSMSWAGWCLWALLLRFVVRLDHPPVPDMTPLTRGRTLVGWLTLVMFVICFCPAPFFEYVPTVAPHQNILTQLIP
jgi:membrane-associated protease RseP (regulator of RpoE activity)